MKLYRFAFLTVVVFFLSLLVMSSMNLPSASSIARSSVSSYLLSDPFLQLPTATSVRVVWFTDFAGAHRHWVNYGQKLDKTVEAVTTKLTRVREDQKSELDGDYQQPTWRDIWRHEAIVTDLIPNQRIPYQVVSVRDGVEIRSQTFTLASEPSPGTPLKILLTSDHQLMPMTAANLQKVEETVGKVDAVFLAGDLVNISDRASEWFDDRRGGAFFPCLQGRAHYELEKDGVKTVYRGGELIQHAPLFTAIGNHEVMGRFSPTNSLGDQFNDAIPRVRAEKNYQQLAEQINPASDPQVKAAWLKANSFNTDTYEEIFTLPQSLPGGKQYYALTFGDIRLVVLYVTNIWRSPDLAPEVKGRYQERVADLERQENWGYGQHIFEPIAKGSPQYRWLETELQSEAFKRAKYKIVMFHHPPHTLGGNIVPPYTDPLARFDYAADGTLRSIRYEYPQANDYIIRDLIPLLESAGVQLVFYGHSHLWNRFVSPSGTHFLETSNVGNTYGAHVGDNKRPVPTDNPDFNYVQIGDPNGLEPVMPTIAPLQDDLGNELPYIASNDITVFSILDTATGTITSYRYDTRQPGSAAIEFDRFFLLTN
jgi:hypothetical protein